MCRLSRRPCRGGGEDEDAPGMPNTEIEARFLSKLLMLTAAALLESGFTPESTSQAKPAAMRASTVAVAALHSEINGQGP